MPEGPVNPEQEKTAVALLIAWLVFGVLGVVAVIGGTALALIKAVQWWLA